MQKRKIKNYYKYIIVNYFLILIFILLSCEINKKLDENRKPEGKFLSIVKLKENLYKEAFKIKELDLVELFLTDSANFRLCVLMYRDDYGYHYKLKMDSNKIAFYLKYPKEENYKLEKITEYTFEELKTKNNLRKKK
jgi:hypothetical protein